jgi:GAF domain-containing protein
MTTVLPPIAGLTSIEQHERRSNLVVSSHAVSTHGSLTTEAMLHAEREKVRRLLHSLRDARFALKTERDARRRFESLYNDLRSKVADGTVSRRPAVTPDDHARQGGSLRRAANQPGATRVTPVATSDATVEKLVALLDSVHAVHTEAQLHNLLTRVMQRSRDLIGATRCCLYLADTAAKTIWSIAHDIPQDNLPDESPSYSTVRFVTSAAGIKLPISTGLAGWVASTGRSLRVKDVYKDARFHPDIDQLEAGFTSSNCVCVPVLADNDRTPLAVIQMLNKADDEEFSEEDEQTLQKLACRCHDAVRKCALFVQIEKLLDSTKQLLTMGDMEKMLVAIMQRAGELLACDHCSLFVVEETTKSLWSLRPSQESSDEEARRAKYQRVEIRIGEGIAGHVAATGSPVCFPATVGNERLDASADERMGFSAKHALCHPIVGQHGHVLGVVLAANKSDNLSGQFRNEDTELLRSFCKLASKAMEKCRQFIRLRSLMQGTRELNTEHDMQTLIRNVTVRAKELVNAERCTLFLLDKSGSELWSYVTDAATTVTVPDGIDAAKSDVDSDAVFRVPLGQGIAGTVASTGEPFVVKDAYMDPLFDASFDKGTGFRTRAVMCFPIRGEAGHVLGVMQMINKNDTNEETAFFNEEDEDLLQALCSHVGVALTNSRLFEKINVLLKTASSLSSNTDTATLIREMIGHARDLLECERATVFIVDEKRNQLWSLAADGTDRIRVNIGQGIAGTVAATGERLQIDDAYNDERFDPATDRATGFRTRNMLCVPMVVADTKQVLGVTQIINKKGGLSFTSDDLELMSAFSAQACVAFRNNQLFKESADSQEHLLSVLRSLRSLIVTFDRNGNLVTLNREDLLNRCVHSRISNLWLAAVSHLTLAVLVYRYFGITADGLMDKPFANWLGAYPNLVTDIKRGLDKNFTESVAKPLVCTAPDKEYRLTYSVSALPRAKSEAQAAGIGLPSRGSGAVVVFAAESELPA